MYLQAICVSTLFLSFPFLTSSYPSSDVDFQFRCPTSSQSPVGCSCRLLEQSVVCCNVGREENLCLLDMLGETSEPVTEIHILSSNLTHLYLTEDIWKSLGVKNISTVVRIRIRNTALVELGLCQNLNKTENIRSELHQAKLARLARKRRYIANITEQAKEKDIQFFSFDQNLKKNKDPQIKEQLPYCEEFTSLHHLDLSGNKLKFLDRMNFEYLKSIQLSGNAWACFRSGIAFYLDWDMGWVLEHRDIFLDVTSTFCMRPPSNKWHNQSNGVTNVTLIEYLDFDKAMMQDCPNNCTCYIININQPLWVKVICEDLNMTDLPDILPPNTQVLDVSYNQITSLIPLRTNPHYNHLKQLIAQSNAISNMDDLTGSPFVNNQPTTLDLRLNQITSFNVDLMRSIIARLDTHHNSVSFSFSMNPWDCSCDRIKVMQEFIYEHKNWLGDSDKMGCGKEEKPLIVSFDFNRSCTIEVGAIDYMSILIGVEVLLLIVVVSKLTYDIWNYRRTGEIPWLARHICMEYDYSNFNRQQRQNSAKVSSTQGSSDETGRFVNQDRHIACLRSCFVCMNDSDDAHSTNTSMRGFDNVEQFRPCRQKDHSHSSESHCSEAVHKTSLPFPGVALRKTSKVNSPKKSPTNSRSLVKLPLLPTHLRQSKKAEILEIGDEDRESSSKLLRASRELRSSENRQSFRAVMEPLDPSIRGSANSDIGVFTPSRKGAVKNISRSTSTLENTAAL